MKILILQSIAGHAEPRYDLADFSFPPGAVVEVNDALAEAWIASGTAKAAKKGQEVNIPPEVYTRKALAVLESQPEAQEAE